MWLRNLLNLIVILSLGLSLATPTIASESQPAMNNIYQDTELQVEFVKAAVREVFGNEAQNVLEIIYCESKSRPYIQWEADGSLRRRDDGKGSVRGNLQIHMKVHKKSIEAAKLDMQDYYQYLIFAKQIMDVREAADGPTHRYDDWLPSKPCWKNKVTPVDNLRLASN